MLYSTLCLLVAIVLTLSGVWVQWNAHGYSMSAEEAMKNRKMTPEQVVRRLILIRRAGRILTFTGIGLMIVSVMMIEG